jgi:hypothetical protein
VKRRPEGKLAKSDAVWHGRRCTTERHSDRPVSSPNHHRFLSAHGRPLMALLCRRRRTGAAGQKLGAPRAYAS